MIRSLVKSIIGATPGLEGAFRRHVWSRLHFSEIELRILDGLPPGSFDVAVDVGAALGSYSWVLARKARRVIAYEPGLQNGAFMERSTRRGRVELVKAAVGSQPGELDLYTAGTGGSSVFTATLSKENPIAAAEDVVVNRVRVVSLDQDLGARLQAGECLDLIKIDVEGFENAVIDGAAGMIATHRPLIICEVEARHNPAHQVLFDTLRGSGYSACFWADGGWHVLDRDIASMQNPDDLERRMHDAAGAAHNAYINNFVFQHSESRIRLVPGVPAAVGRA